MPITYRARVRVLGRWKVTEVLILDDLVPFVPLSAAFFADLALASCGALAVIE